MHSIFRFFFLHFFLFFIFYFTFFILLYFILFLSNRKLNGSIRFNLVDSDKQSSNSKISEPELSKKNAEVKVDKFFLFFSHVFFLSRSWKILFVWRETEGKSWVFPFVSFLVCFQENWKGCVNSAASLVFGSHVMGIRIRSVGFFAFCGVFFSNEAKDKRILNICLIERNTTASWLSAYHLFEF